MYNSNNLNPKCLVNIFEIKKLYQLNTNLLLECKINSHESKIIELMEHISDINKLLDSKLNSIIETKLNSLMDSKIISVLKENIVSFNKNPLNNIFLKVYPKTISILLNNNPNPDSYFIENSKLYKYDINGQNPHLVYGNFLFTKTDNPNYLNKAFKVSNDGLEQIQTYFDGTNLKLIIEGIEENREGTLILTDDYKIFIKIGNSWFGK